MKNSYLILHVQAIAIEPSWWILFVSNETGVPVIYGQGKTVTGWFELNFDDISKFADNGVLALVAISTDTVRYINSCLSVMAVIAWLSNISQKLFSSACIINLCSVCALCRAVTVSHHQIDTDNLVDMGSSNHHHKVTVSHKVISNQQAAMELLLMASHMVMVPLANSLVLVTF